MFRITILFIAILLYSANARAAESSAKAVFQEIARNVSTGDNDAIAQRLTSDSQSLFSRFASYGLTACLPKDASFIAARPLQKHTVITGRFTVSGGERKESRLWFRKETGVWKLDIPTTLEQGMGSNWQTQVNASEQIYLLLKQQLGDKLNCKSINQLVLKQ